MIGQEARIPGYRIHDAGFRILRVGIPKGLEERMYQIPKHLNS